MANEGKRGIKDDCWVFGFSNRVHDATPTEVRNPRRDVYFQGKKAVVQQKLFWSKPFCGLSLATMLALEQVSIINNLKGTKECRNREKAAKQQYSDKAES